MESLSFSFFLSCTQHLKNRKNRKPRKSALKFSIGISALGLSAPICPTCRYLRPCISLNTSNWPLKLCGHILEFIHGWFMEKFFFRFFGPYKADPCLKIPFRFGSYCSTFSQKTLLYAKKRRDFAKDVACSYSLTVKGLRAKRREKSKANQNEETDKSRAPAWKYRVFANSLNWRVKS